MYYFYTKLFKFSSKFLTILFLIWPSFINNANYVINAFEIEKELNDDYLNYIPIQNYIIGKGDILRIKVSRQLGKEWEEHQIDIDGTINLKRLNRIYINGLTINELTKILNARFAEFLINPEVEIEIARYRPINVLVKGEVNNPGLHTMTGQNRLDDLGEDMLISDTTFGYPTLFKAIQKAGGISVFSDLSNVEITRKNTLSNGGGRIKTTINFLDILQEGDSTLNIRILDGDIINIKRSNKPVGMQIMKAIQTNLNPRFINVFVTGRVDDPGQKTVNKLSTLNDAIELSGGAKILKGNVFFLRYESNGEIDKRKFNYKKDSKRGSYSNPYLKGGDLISINKGPIASTNEVLGEILDPISKIANTIGIYKLLTD